VYNNSSPVSLSEIDDCPSKPEPNELFITVGSQLSKLSAAETGVEDVPEF